MRRSLEEKTTRRGWGSKAEVLVLNAPTMPFAIMRSGRTLRTENSGMTKIDITCTVLVYFNEMYTEFFIFFSSPSLWTVIVGVADVGACKSVWVVGRCGSSVFENSKQIGGG